MAQVFAYKARDAQGAPVAGRLRSADTAGVIRYLDEQDLIPISVHPEHADLAHRLGRVFQRAPGPETRILFMRQFATLYASGIPLLRSLGMLADQEREPGFRAVLLDVHKQVEGGTPLWEALAEHPRVFGRLFVEAVKTGEASGKLDEVLQKTAEFLEREMTTREEVRAALRYPVMVVCALAAAFTVIITFVVPRFAAVYGKFGSELPGATRLLIAASGLVVGGWYWFLPLLALLVVAAVRLMKTERGAEWRDRWMLRVPALGPLFLKASLARFAHMLAILFDSGLPVIESLTVVAQGMPNRVVAGEVMKIAENFRGGREATHRLDEGRVFPPLAIQMIAVGLETHALGRMLRELASHYDREVSYASRRLTNVLEPFLIFGLSGLVLVMALAVLLPMWNLMNVFNP